MRIPSLFWLFFFSFCPTLTYCQVEGLASALIFDSNLATSKNIKAVEIKNDSGTVFSFEYDPSGNLISYSELSGSGIVYSEKYDEEGNVYLMAKTNRKGDTVESILKSYDQRNQIVRIKRFLPGSYSLEYGGESLTPDTKVDSFFYNPSGTLIGHKTYWDDRLEINTITSYSEDSIRTDIKELKVQDAFQVYRIIEQYDTIENLLYRKRFVKDIYDTTRALIDSLKYEHGKLVEHNLFEVSLKGWKLVSSYTYSYDSKGRKTKEEILGSYNRTIIYRYDRQGRLIGTKELQDNKELLSTHFSYDNKGRLVSYFKYIGKYHSGYKISYTKSGQLKTYDEVVNGVRTRLMTIQFSKGGMPSVAIVRSQEADYALKYEYFFY